MSYKDFRLKNRICVGLYISAWKVFISDFVPCRMFFRCSDFFALHYFFVLALLPWSVLGEVVVVAWGGRIHENGLFLKFCDFFGVQVLRVEDGFLRSSSLGLCKSRPFSLIVDDSGIYYDPQNGGKLEQLLMEYDFDSDESLLKRAEESLRSVIDLSLTKYMVSSCELTQCDSRDSFVLVVGQVVDDLSVLLGCPGVSNDLDLLKIAIKENPGKKIFYKPHPDVISGGRKGFASLSQYSEIASIWKEDIISAFERSSHVYTLTSIVGFEALMRGIPVSVFGLPFYSGWGIADDRVACSWRNRQLDVLKVFSAAYLLYPKYIGCDGCEISKTANVGLEFKRFISGVS